MKFKVYCVNDNFLKFLEYRKRVDTLKESVEMAQRENVPHSNFKNFNNKIETDEIVRFAKESPELMRVIKSKDWNKSAIVVVKHESYNAIVSKALDLIELAFLDKLQQKKSNFKKMKLLDSFEFHLETLHSDNLLFLELF